jgi:hypothetical protein
MHSSLNVITTDHATTLKVQIRPVDVAADGRDSDSFEFTKRFKEFEIEDSEVYDIEIAMSTGEGKPRTGDVPTTVFRRDVTRQFNLRMKAARHVYVNGWGVLT